MTDSPETDSPELVAFKRKVYVRALQVMREYGRQQQVRALLKNIGLSASDIASSLPSEPEAEGMYEMKGIATTQRQVFFKIVRDDIGEIAWYVPGNDEGLSWEDLISDLLTTEVLSEDDDFAFTMERV